MTADPLNLVGTTLADKYAVERLVGEGGFALVYRATHTIWKRPVALKVFRHLGRYPLERQKELIESFVREGSVLAELSERSAAIVQARDIGTLAAPDGAHMPYMVLEWLDGTTLDHVLETESAAGRAPRSLEEARALLEPVAEALALAHRRGIAHRDVKPANLFVLGDPADRPTVKILDFGIAKVVTEAERSGGGFNKTQGVFSNFTPAYGAPEQYSKQLGATGPWTDVFALALILVEVLSGAAALVGDDLAQLGFASTDPNRRPTPRTRGVAVSDAVEAVFARALAVEPGSRYADAADFWNALRVAMELAPLSAAALDAGARSSVRSLPAAPAARAIHAAPTLKSDGLPMANTITPDSLLSSVSSSREARSQPADKRRVGVFVAIGLAVVALGGVGAAARSLLRGGATVASTGSTSSPPPSAVPPPPAPKPSCPAGMIEIPGGKFFMGSDEKAEWAERERPAHKVQLAPYCIDRFEVTTAQYKACSDKGDCKRASTENDFEGITDKLHKTFDPLCNIRDPAAMASHPINCVDWQMAVDYCQAAGKRLPTEAEWEFATRGSDGRTYPWGDEVPTAGHLNACGKECLAWSRKRGIFDQEAMYPKEDDGFPTTAPVGSFPKGKSVFGVEDVVGNVWEWTSDWYAPYSTAVETDPKGPSTGKERVIRGGAWNGSQPTWVRPTFRYSDVPTSKSYGIGFRCAKPL